MASFHACLYALIANFRVLGSCSTTKNWQRYAFPSTLHDTPSLGSIETASLAYSTLRRIFSLVSLLFDASTCLSRIERLRNVTRWRCCFWKVLLVTGYFLATGHWLAWNRASWTMVKGLNVPRRASLYMLLVSSRYFLHRLAKSYPTNIIKRKNLWGRMDGRMDGWTDEWMDRWI